MLDHETGRTLPYSTIPGVERPLSRLVIGTMPFDGSDLVKAFEILDAFAAAGGNAFDTAHSYHGGAAELTLGKWLAARSLREQAVVISKGAHPAAGKPRVTPQAIGDDLAESLQRLQTGTIDLYLLHRDDPSQPVGPIVACLNEHMQAGRIGAYGASNWSTARIDEANRYAAEHKLAGFVAGSINLSLAVPNAAPWDGCLWLTPESERWYTEHHFPLLAWSALAQGFFSGRYRPDDRTDEKMVRVWYGEDNFARLARAAELAERKDVSPSAIDLAYVLHQPFPSFALFGPYSVDEVNDSMSALQVTLTPEEVAWLRHGDAMQEGPGGLNR
jgi:1-deoxyxylulose-5-phosphate synthase